MNPISWDVCLQVGHATMDEQHREILDLIKSLHMALSEETGNAGLMLNALKDYMVAHFQMEEDLMNHYGYPGAAKHKAVHHDLMVQLQGLVVKEQNMPTELTPSLLEALEEWMMDHIQTEDYQMAELIRRKTAIS